MGKGLLFKWEDSPALSHHCGFCDRPLSHPGARSSCYGTHSEPCWRYHQAMFMRLRSHTCHYCHTIDEAHHKRHKKIGKCIRDVYECYEDLDWTIIPSEFEERGRAREYSAVSSSSGDSGRPGSEETPASKRERKDAKNLARAASRSRVISQDEINYVDSVMHATDNVLGDGEGPRNNEELEEINRHLIFNAHVYNSMRDNKEIKKYARLPDVDVDFDAEIERILEAFRIDELLQRNVRNRGLQGKELKTFVALVADLKTLLVEDLVSVKRDMLEIRMRRAGYLRYTNKTAHDLVTQRYTDKNWKTGERYFSNTSDSSVAEAAPDELDPQCSSPSPLPRTATKHGPDLRHLEKTHLRVNGDDGLGDKVIEPYNAPLLPASADNTAKKRAVQLNVVDKKPMVLTLISNAKTTPLPIDSSVWNTVLSSKKPKTPTVKPAWGMDAYGRPAKAPRPAVNPWGDGETEIPDLRITKPAAVQSADDVAITPARGPDGFVDDTEATDAGAAEEVGHAVVSQKKKAKKYEREARRKAKKVAVQAEASSLPVPTAEKSENAEKIDIKPADSEASRVKTDLGVKPTACQAPPPDAILITTIVEAVSTDASAVPSTPDVAVAESSEPALPRVTQSDKHVNWTKFKREFLVDQLTDPCLQTWSGCAHGSSCTYEANGVVDCPFHEPHCSCVDPLADECYLVYPCSDVASSGPYNRLRGQKLFEMYQKEEEFKGRIMLVDNDLLHYFMTDPRDRALNRDSSLVPKRLAREYADYADGFNPGLLMEQEKQFERLWTKNNVIKHKLTPDSLMRVQREKFEAKGEYFMCYCYADFPTGPIRASDIIECAYRDCSMKYFHKACVKKLAVEKVSRWMCTMCEEKMRTAAYRVLRELGYNDVPDDDAVLDAALENLREKYSATDEQIGKVRERVSRVRGGAARVDVLAMAMSLGGI